MTTYATSLSLRSVNGADVPMAGDDDDDDDDDGGGDDDDDSSSSSSDFM